MGGRNHLSRRIPHVAAITAIALLFLVFNSVFAAVGENGKESSAEPIWIFDSDLDVRLVATADLNGDGTADVIAAEYNNTYYGNISYVHAVDGKTGIEIWNYPVDDGIRSMTIGDLTNDGVMDVIAGASYDGANTPDGRVHAINGLDGSRLWVFYNGTTNNAITTGHFDGDEFLDVAVGCFDDHIYAISGRNGAQIWARNIGSLWINAVAAGDVDNDGIDDVAFAHEYLAGFDNYIGVLDGTDGSDIWALTVPYLGMDVIMDDIDNDGVIEAVFGVIYSDDHGEIFVRTALDGTIEWTFNLGSVNHSNGEIILRSFNLDEDSDLDLIIGTYLGDRRIYAFDGESDATMWISDPLDGNVKDISFGDVTGEKDIDVVAATSDRVEVVDGTNGAKLWYYAVNGNMSGVSCADFDEDEIMDVAAGGGADHVGTDPGKTVWALRTVQSPLLWEYAFGEYGNGIAVADLNGDGYDDPIAVCSLDDQAIAINGLTGTQLWRWTGTENLYSVTTGDYDHDGTADAAVGGYDETVTAIYGKTGTAIWQFTTPSAQIYRKCLASADLNGDGADEVIAGSDDARVYAIQTDTKSEFWSVGVGAAVNDIELGQANTGPLDVYVAVGGGTYGKKVVCIDGSDGSVLWEASCPESVEHIAVGDVNDDGVPDVAAAITPFTKQVLMIDGATQTTIWTQPVDIASNVQSIDCGDLDGDKNPDVVVPGGSTDRKVHALSAVDGHELWSFETGGEVNCVMVYDVDLDEQNDVIAGSDDQNIYVLNGLTGDLMWSYSCADDVMDVDVGDISGDGLPNMTCVTFGSSGVIYAFKSLATAPTFLCGDANGSDDINILDITFLINYIYREGAAPDPLESADADGSGAINLLDITYLINYIYKGGPEPIC